VSRNSTRITMWDLRAQRARFLAERYPPSRDILTFYSSLAEWQGRVAAQVSALPDLPPLLPSLVDLVNRTGPEALIEAADELDKEEFGRMIGKYWESPGHFSTHEFFVRAMLQPYAGNLPVGECPWCRHPPQTGCLRPHGEGLAFDIICALCLRRHP